jgi:peptidoglycan L-alanyl-D-glutamate endopeptidase CwlK
MPFSKTSMDRLNTCHPDLRVLLIEVDAMGFECSVLCGERGKEAQDKAVAKGASQTPWPKSKHNNPVVNGVKRHPEGVPAVDAAPWYRDTKIPWDIDARTAEGRENLRRWYLFCGFVRATAECLYREGKMQHRVRGGHDWDGDMTFSDQRFHDLPHWELIGVK